MHAIQIDNTLTDGICYLAASNHCTADFKYCRNQQSLRNGQCAGADTCTERVGNIVTTHIKRHKDAEKGSKDKQAGVVVVGITQAPINKIADHAHKHSGKNRINQLQVRTRLSLSHGKFPFGKHVESRYFNLFVIFLAPTIYIKCRNSRKNVKRR